MSRIVRAGSEGGEALAAATAEHVIQARGITTAKYELAKLRIAFDQQPTTELENVIWRLVRNSTDGTATGATELKDDDDDPTPNITAFHSFTAEPTVTDVLEEGYVPANGAEVLEWAEGDGPKLDAATSSRIGVEVTSSAVVNVRASFGWRPVTG